MWVSGEEIRGVSAVADGDAVGRLPLPKATRFAALSSGKPHQKGIIAGYATRSRWELAHLLMPLLLMFFLALPQGRML
jgi:hypothetical protein